jgi:hypothetical protein
MLSRHSTLPFPACSLWHPTIWVLPMKWASKLQSTEWALHCTHACRCALMTKAKNSTHQDRCSTDNTAMTGPVQTRGSRKHKLLLQSHARPNSLTVDGQQCCCPHMPQDAKLIPSSHFEPLVKYCQWSHPKTWSVVEFSLVAYTSALCLILQLA